MKKMWEILVPASNRTEKSQRLIDRIRSDDGDVTLYRPGSDEPFGISEYMVGTKTRDMFEKWESEGYQRLPNGKLIHLPYEEVTEILECLKS